MIFGLTDYFCKYYLYYISLFNFLFYLKIEEVDMIEHLTEIPFGAYQLILVILNNAQLRKEFSSNALAIFSSNAYKNV